MAVIKSGILALSKTDREALKVLSFHAQQNINYGWDGSYGGYDEEDKKAVKRSEREVAQSKVALNLIEFIYKNF